MTHDEIKAQLPGIEITTGDSGEFLWLRKQVEHLGQHFSWSRRAPLDPSQEAIDAFKADLAQWEAGVQEQ